MYSPHRLLEIHPIPTPQYPSVSFPIRCILMAGKCLGTRMTYLLTWKWKIQMWINKLDEQWISIFGLVNPSPDNEHWKNVSSLLILDTFHLDERKNGNSVRTARKLWNTSWGPKIPPVFFFSWLNGKRLLFMLFQTWQNHRLGVF